MQEVEIETDVPLPEPIVFARYAFDKMKVGGSMFFAELPQVESAQTSARDWAKRNNPTFRVTRRKVEGGYRLWRIK